MTATATSPAERLRQARAAHEEREAERQRDVHAIADALALFHAPGDVYEIRALDCHPPRGGRPCTASGYFSDAHKAAGAIVTFDAVYRPGGIYHTINPCDPQLYGRCPDKIEIYPKTSTADHDITGRRLLLIDVDPDRPAGTMASEAQRAAAHDLMYAADEWLRSMGWPTPVIADSGSGYHMFFRIDLPNDSESLKIVSDVLAGVRAQLVSEWYDPAKAVAKIDITVGNPSRIARVPGTMNCKGGLAKLWRRCELFPPPDGWAETAVSVECLRSVAALATAQTASANGHTPGGTASHHAGNGQAAGGRFDIAQFVGRYFPDAKGPDAWKGSGRIWTISPCPYNTEHADKAAYIGVLPSGAIVAGCHHDGCSGWGWAELRERYEPGYREQRRKNDTASGQSATGQSQPAAVTYERVTCAELANGTYDLEFLIDDILVARQPCIFAGSKKTLKTSLLIALALALASGRHFLGKFAVRRLARVLMMSGESGLATIQDTAVRIAAAQDVDLAAVENLIFSPSLPIFGSDPHMDALRELLMADKIEVLIVDPAYLSMPTDGNEGSLFAMGALLRSMAMLCQELEVTFILAHHTRKNLADPYAMPELEDIAWAGFNEFARQWLLVGRRERYEPGTGNHQLWFNVGGSAGHSSCWALGINEGAFHRDTPRKWEVTLTTAQEARGETEKRRQGEREEKRKASSAAQLEADRKAIVAVMIKLPDQTGTKTDIRDLVNINPPRFRAAWASLFDERLITETEMKKGNNRNYSAWKLKGDADE